MRNILILCFALTGCAGGLSQYGTPPLPALVLQESDAGKSIDVQPGRKLTFRLEANHATGYRWAVATGGERFEQLGEPFYTAEKGVSGGGGAEYWTFVPKRAGSQAFRFEYRRPWERDKAPAKALDYAVNVR